MARDDDPVYVVDVTPTAEQSEREAMGWMIGIALIAAPFFPIFYASRWVYLQLVTLKVHDLFCFLLAAGVVLVGFVLLKISRWIRLFYFGSETIVGAVICFNLGTDYIWGSFFAIIVLIIGGALTNAAFEWS